MLKRLMGLFARKRERTETVEITVFVKAVGEMRVRTAKRIGDRWFVKFWNHSGDDIMEVKPNGVIFPGTHEMCSWLPLDPPNFDPAARLTWPSARWGENHE